MSILGTIATAAAVTLIPGAGIALAVWKYGKEAVIGFLKNIPTKVWIGLAIAAALVAGYFIHQHKAKAALAAEYARGVSDEDAKWQKRLDAEHKAAMDWKAKADAAAVKITQEERARNEAERDAIAARADDQRVRGPGKAAAPAGCRSSGATGLPAPASGHRAAGAPVDAGLAVVPSDEPMALVPWSGLTFHGRVSDEWRSEALTWRAWYAREAKAWLDAKAAAPKP